MNVVMSLSGERIFCWIRISSWIHEKIKYGLRHLKCTEFKLCEKSTFQSNLLLLIYQGIKANTQVSNDLYISLESGKTNIFLIRVFTVAKLSFKIRYIFGDTQYIYDVLRIFLSIEFEQLMKSFA